MKRLMIIGALVVAGLAIAIFYSYRKPRHYEDLPVEGAAEKIVVKPHGRLVLVR